jgi:hypothetical protein
MGSSTPSVTIETLSRSLGGSEIDEIAGDMSAWFSFIKESVASLERRGFLE